REELPWQPVRAFIEPLIPLFQDAVQLGKDRARLAASAFTRARQKIYDRFDDLLLGCRSRHPECLRIWQRLFKHCDELFTYGVPPVTFAVHYCRFGKSGLKSTLPILPGEACLRLTGIGTARRLPASAFRAVSRNSLILLHGHPGGMGGSLSQEVRDQGRTLV